MCNGLLFLFGRYLEDDEDQLDNIPRFQPTFKSPHEATHYQFINSERDLTLPLQKHKNVQPLYESPDDGKPTVSYHISAFTSALTFQKFRSESIWVPALT